MFPEGFSWKETSGNIAFEKPHGAKGDEYTGKVKKLLDSSGGLLPDQPESDMHFMTVTSTHTNLVCRIVDREPIGVYPDLIADGRISKEKILRECPSFREAVEQGMEWTIFRKELEE